MVMQNINYTVPTTWNVEGGKIQGNFQEILDSLRFLGLDNQRYVKTLLTSANIKDVFIYDTSKDSDGGAWRLRCQKLSWYNEPLNTATRGATREFPAVALIVAEVAKVTIYDATVVGCPMWMVFLQNAFAYLRTHSVTAVQMLNGELFVTGNATGLGSSWTSFIKDASIASLYSGVGENAFRVTLPINGRNNTLAANRVPADDIAKLVNGVSNDVAMAVLPDAPIDPDTLIQVPTIVVGTNGGVSVIDGPAGVGTVVDQVYGVNEAHNISIHNGRVSTYYRTNSVLMNIPLSGYTSDYSSSSANSTVANYPGSYFRNAGSIPALLFYAPLSAKKGIAGKAQAMTTGLGLLVDDLITPTNSMVSYITKSYNTGWMKGDIRRSLICDAGGTTDTLTATTIADRSVKATSLNVIGALTREPVAAGAELQCISGFGSSNYLKQDYSSDLDFSTGDFYQMGWMKVPVDVTGTLLSRTADNGANGMYYYISSTGTISTMLGTGSAVERNTVGIVDIDQWLLFTLVRRDGVVYRYFNYTLDSSFLLSASLDTMNPLELGKSTFATSGIKLALWRFGAGSLTDEQIAEIYRTELPLFQPNAKCTIQGNSDAVQALSYDERYNHLLVGTGDGVTAFNDLVVDDYVASGNVVSVSGGDAIRVTGTTTEAIYSK